MQLTYTFEDIEAQFGELIDVPEEELSSTHGALRALLWALCEEPEAARLVGEALRRERYK